jgi:hypothetical protein
MCLIQHGGAAEINFMPRFKSVFNHSRLLWLAQAHASQVLHAWCLYSGFFYNPEDGITKKLPLFPATANFYMEFF